MPAWDRRATAAIRKEQDAALRTQLRDAIGPFSPFWRERFAQLGTRAADVTDVAGLARLPAVGERDVCPDGDPSAAARLVLQSDEIGFALHAPGLNVRRAITRRLYSLNAYR